jgi:hypothetical protein
MVSRTHFLTEFDLHLVDLAFVPRIHNGVRGVDESLSPIIAPRLLGEVLGSFRDQPPPIPTVQRPRVWSELGYFWMTGTRTVLNCLDTGIFTAEMCAIHFACDLIESKPMGAYIILTDALASIEGLKSSGMSY